MGIYFRQIFRWKNSIGDANDSSPLIRTIAMAPSPIGVEIAVIVSCSMNLTPFDEQILN